MYVHTYIHIAGVPFAAPPAALRRAGGGCGREHAGARLYTDIVYYSVHYTIHYIILYYTVLYYTILYYTILLYRTILYYTAIPYYAIL